jgi:hypothetical protein
MRRSLISLVAGTLFTITTVSSTSAQRHEIPQLNSCIKEFLDPEMYNYLTFKNTCSNALSLVFIAKDGSGAHGSMDLRPGAKDSVGKMQDIVPKVGTFELFVCEMGYIPVDETNQVVSKPGSSFRCQAKDK